MEIKTSIRGKLPPQACIFFALILEIAYVPIYGMVDKSGTA